MDSIVEQSRKISAASLAELLVVRVPDSSLQCGLRER